MAKLNYEAIQVAQQQHNDSFMAGNLLTVIRTLPVETVRALLATAYVDKIQANYYVHDFSLSGDGKDVYVKLQRKSDLY